MTANETALFPVAEFQAGLLNSTRDKVLIIFYTLTIVLGTTGNSVVIWTAGVRLPLTVTNVWLVNLAVADLVFCLTRVLSLLALLLCHWPFGIFLCRFNGLFKYTNMFCSVFLLAVISLDRTLCVRRPLVVKRRRTLALARLVSVGVWVAALTLSAPYSAHRRTMPGTNNRTKCTMDTDGGARFALYTFRFLCGFLLPFLVITCCYVLTGLGIRHTRLTRRSKAMRILVLLVSAFFLCWAPYHCLLLAKMVDPGGRAVRAGLPLAQGLAYFNSCVNPLLYFCIGLDRRKRLKESLSGACRRALQEEGEGPLGAGGEQGGVKDDQSPGQDIQVKGQDKRSRFEVMRMTTMVQ